MRESYCHVERRPEPSVAAAKLLLPRALLADGRPPEEVHSKTGRSNLRKASAVLYDDIGDARKARLVLDEPHCRVKVISVQRQAPWSWEELMTAVDQIGAMGMSQALCESGLSSNHTVGQLRR